MSAAPRQKATATPSPSTSAPQPQRGLLADIVQLGKPRITGLVLISCALGYMLGRQGSTEWMLFGAMLLATLCVSWGIHALNQYMERDIDALMPRTCGRPLPAGRMQPERVFYAGLAVTTVGLGLMIVSTTLWSALVAAAVVVLYLGAYTPLKRVSQLNTLVGAVPGALPAVLGWVTARDAVGPGAMALFLIMFVWQLPHFLPIAWLYRFDYRRAGLKMITVSDPSGASLRRQQVLYTGTLILVSLYPTLIGMAGMTYFVGALVLGAMFLAASSALAISLTDARARMVLKVSVIYLPLLLALLAYDVNPI